MTIASGKTVTVSADGQMNWIPLGNGQNRVFIKCDSWSGSSLAMELNDEDSTDGAPLEDDDGAVVVTSNKSFDVDGPGFIGGVMSSYGGTAVTVRVTDEFTDLPLR